MYQINCTSDFNNVLNLVKNCLSSRYPEYATFSKRFQSLSNFPSALSDKLKLFEAEFFSKPRDSVQCFYCSLILSNWANGDCPFRKHAAFSNKCTFSLLNQFINFINNVTNSFKYKGLNSTI